MVNSTSDSSPISVCVQREPNGRFGLVQTFTPGILEEWTPSGLYVSPMCPPSHAYKEIRKRCPYMQSPSLPFRSHNARGTPRIHPSGSASFLVTENVSGQAERRPQKDDGGSHRTPTFQSPHWRSYQDPVHQRNATRRRSLEQIAQWDPSQPGPNRSSYDSSAFSSDISESEHPLRPPTPSQSSLDLCGGMRSGQFGQHPRVPPSSGPSAVHNSPSSSNTGFPWNYSPRGMLMLLQIHHLTVFLMHSRTLSYLS
ncbi:hypothetical protein KIN20_035614 [Parelaphostrongylus tenuis]|uniref:Uncharacterized protein n=1 Tax=Parelaphostrongylus tenuis TaxID=148309 RepID=A0AAD5RBN9_PARTN|nr:hypothetical protein KIN20_035614 [Parelaphostrongylus tenuis]